jgi:beta-1,4-N-acetylglucosaminyltransferase
MKTPISIFVTVGTTAFDQLIEAVDAQLSGPQFDVTCQIADGKYLPKIKHVRFSDDFLRRFAQANVVITHGGAGTVFELLEQGKKIVVVPNLFRVDKHQTDLAKHVEQNNFGAVCWSLAELTTCLERCIDTTFNPYSKDPFFMAGELLEYFGMCD